MFVHWFLENSFTPSVVLFYRLGVSVLYIPQSKRFFLYFEYWQQQCESWKEKAWSHNRNVTTKEPCPDTNRKGVIWVLHILIVKCQTPQGKSTITPRPDAFRVQSQTTHFQSVTQKLGKWVKARCCSKLPAEGCSCWGSKTGHQWNLGRVHLAP